MLSGVQQNNLKQLVQIVFIYLLYSLQNRWHWLWLRLYCNSTIHFEFHIGLKLLSDVPFLYSNNAEKMVLWQEAHQYRRLSQLKWSIPYSAIYLLSEYASIFAFICVFVSILVGDFWFKFLDLGICLVYWEHTLQHFRYNESIHKCESFFHINVCVPTANRDDH